MSGNKYPHALQKGTMLSGNQYFINAVLGCGGCGITYYAYDWKQKKEVAIKECFSDTFCVRGESGKDVEIVNNPEEFNKIKNRFREEIELLRQCTGIAGAMPVYDIFEENNTVYYVMQYLEGMTLKEYLLSLPDKKIPVQEVKELLYPVFNALENLHRAKVFHRDISPDNIFILKTGETRLIDFGSARVIETGKSRRVDFAKEGYAPLEEYYDDYRQGSWTDVYSLAATIYRCITGEVPINSRERVRGQKLPSPQKYGIILSDTEEEILMKALSVYPEDRIGEMGTFREGWYGKNWQKAEPVQPVRRVRPPAQSAEVKKAEVRPVLVGLEGVYAGKEIPIEHLMRMGRRKEECDIPFPPDTLGVSGTHCEVFFDKKTNCLILRDLKSTYGTRLLNEEVIAPQQKISIRPGEGFIVGDNQIFAFKL